MPYYSLVLALICLCYSTQAQVRVVGHVYDAHSKLPLPQSVIVVQETRERSVTDSNGAFYLNLVTDRFYHISCKHYGCPTQLLYVYISSDTNIIFYLEHHINKSLEEIQTQGKRVRYIKSVIDQSTQLRMHGQGIAKLADQTTGVSVIGGTAGTSKPVIHGLSNNRLTVLVQGAALGSQRWGFDHEPEIDAMQDAQMSILTGAQLLSVQDNAYGAAISVEQAAIKDEPHIHGRYISSFHSNGKLYSGSIKLEQAKKHFRYRIQASAQSSGDKYTPNYILRNTGSRSQNFSTFITSKTKKGNQQQFYYALVRQRFGILYGTQVETASDLQQALARPEPFGTRDTFYRSIANPQQQSTHQTLIYKNRKDYKSGGYKQFTASSQLNNRIERDLRRGAFANKASLHMLLNTNQLQLLYAKNNNASKQYGVQFRNANNYTVPGTGLVPLVPNYSVNSIGGFWLNNKRYRKVLFDYGARQDVTSIFAYNQQTGGVPVAQHNLFYTVGTSGGMQYETQQTKFIVSTAVIMRNPEVNELHSTGLHQGIAALEYGNPNLKQEVAWNTNAVVQWQSKNERFNVSTQPYVNLINNYIYLAGTNELRLTLRGTFPVFKFTQANALLVGNDFNAHYEAEHFLLKYSYGFIRAKNLEQKTWLPFMPSDRHDIRLQYALSANKLKTDITLFTHYRYVAQQNRYQLSEDYLASPPRYNLINAGVDFATLLNGKECTISIQGQNILNTSYRDFLNRMRYYADAEARNIMVIVQYKF